jgi:dihydrofolate synthase/folylpolyglutamate synthase
MARLIDSMNYRECQKYLADLGHELHGLKFGLEAITQILAALGYPHERYATAIVAGTNGKGSTCAMLASILQSAGYRTGLYTSPHLVRVNERMRVNGAEITDEEFAKAFSEVAATVERLIKAGALKQTPSFFEFLTATAFLHFANLEAQFVVLEVGMGGRLDATNVTDPRVAVITNVDFDHMEFLGTTLAAIAAEKAGVIKPHRAVISGAEDPQAAAVIRRRAEESEAELAELASLAKVTRLRSKQGRYTFDLEIGEEYFAGLTAPLLGKFQVNNTVAAVAAAWRLQQEGFQISRRHILSGLRAAAWPGRLEPVLRQPLVLLDGGHNPAAARELAAFLRQELPGRQVRLVYGSMRDKAIGAISEILFPLAHEVYLTRPDHPRAAAPEEIAAALEFRPPSLHQEADPARALDQALRASAPNDVVLAFGSLFLVGAIKAAQSEGRLAWRGSQRVAPTASAR